MNFHPLANIFPLLEGQAFDELVADIKANGLRVPIILHTDGTVLDGRNRFRACVAANVAPRFEQWDGEGFASDFVWSLNGPRRHLDGGALVIAAGKFSIAREAEARERQLAALRNVGSSVSIDTNDQAGRSREVAAEKFGVPEATVARSVKVLKDGTPELVHAVESGAVSVSAAADVATLPKSEQVEIVARGEREILEAAKRIRTERAEARRAELDAVRAVQPALPDGRYGCIVIDPPWQMEKIEREVRPNQVAFDYPTMDEAALAAFGVPSISADDCHLFCWATHKHLPLALRLLDVWGFRYVCTMVWHKPGGFQPVGLPQYNCEFVLYARRGSPQFIDTKAFPCCFEAPRREHSRKPDEFYDVVGRVTAGPRIDVFSREKRLGFDQFGNEPERFAA